MSSRRALASQPNMLTRWLDALVEAGLLERRRYSEHRRAMTTCRPRAGVISDPCFFVYGLGQQALRV
jgi:hypothetical protein